MRWDQSELTIDRGVMREAFGKIEYLGEWNEKSSDYIHDFCELFLEMARSGADVYDRHWMLYFEAEKWAKTLKEDTSLMIEGINELIYPEGIGR